MNECDNESIIPYMISENSLANRVCVGKEDIQRRLMKPSLAGLDAQIKISDWFDCVSNPARVLKWKKTHDVNRVLRSVV